MQSGQSKMDRASGRIDTRLVLPNLRAGLAEMVQVMEDYEIEDIEHYRQVGIAIDRLLGAMTEMVQYPKELGG